MEELLKTKLDGVFAGYAQNSQTQDLYDEVLANLLDAAKDLTAQGLSENQAAQQAFDEVGDLTEVLDEISASTSVLSNLTENSQVLTTSLALANEQVFALSNLTEIKLLYQADNLELAASKDDKIHLQEYMNSQNPDYLAKIQQEGQLLKIQGGQRPRLFGVMRPFRSKSVLYLPTSFEGKLSVELLSGNLTGENLDLTALNLTCQSGNCHIRSSKCGEFILDLSSGNLEVTDLATENLTIKAGSGNLKFQNVRALNATLQVQSGNVRLSEGHFTNLNSDVVRGNLKIFTSHLTNGQLLAESGNIQAELDTFSQLLVNSSSGNIHLYCAASASFDFELQSARGNVKINSADTHYKVKTLTYQTGQVGQFSDNQLTVKSENGNVVVKTSARQI